MKTRSVAYITDAQELDMGGTIVKQPLPTQRVNAVDPFLLMHHFGPYEVAPGTDPLDVGPHPHRGFEPVTFLYRGGIRHRDSRDNTGILEGGDVQWMTAGRGIIHSERASRAFLETGGVMEGIQLWINLPANRKMIQPAYQDIKSAQIPIWHAPDGLSSLRIVAGSFQGIKGIAQTQTPIEAFQLTIQKGGQIQIPLPSTHHALIYTLTGEVQLNQNWSYGAGKMVVFRQDGEGILINGLSDYSEVLVLSGEPLNEEVVQYGPFVMNTQTQIMEAMRDYQMGKMGVYIEG
ncbi:MAG: pirin family protein [Saprospiraceae bacterium]